MFSNAKYRQKSLRTQSYMSCRYSHKELGRYSLKSLGSYSQTVVRSPSLFNQVKLPDGEDRDKWIASSVVDFFNEVSFLYGLCADDGKRFTKPGEGFPPNFEYLWADSNARKAIRVSSPEYVDYTMTWVEDQIDNEEIFPVSESDPFPENFLDYVRPIFKKLFRIFAIIYHQHFAYLEEMGQVPRLNVSFKHFMFFSWEFELMQIDDSEFSALEGPVTRLREVWMSDRN